MHDQQTTPYGHRWSSQKSLTHMLVAERHQGALSQAAIRSATSLTQIGAGRMLRVGSQTMT